MERQLSQALDLPESVALVFDRIDQLQAPLLAPEEEAVAHACAKRRREFIAGRTAARIACGHLGTPPCPIPAATDRTPVWPRGVVGSISHSDASCAVLAGHSTKWLTMGIDIEQVGRCTPDLWPLVFSGEEILRLEQHNPEEATEYFCLKEAFFKLQYRLTNTVIDYRELEVIPLREQTYRLRASGASAEAGMHIETEGKTQRIGDEVIAVCLLARR